MSHNPIKPRDDGHPSTEWPDIAKSRPIDLAELAAELTELSNQYDAMAFVRFEENWKKLLAKYCGEVKP